MNKPTIADCRAEGQVPLISNRAVTKSLPLISRGQQQTEPRRESSERWLIQIGLEPIVEQHIANPIYAFAALADKTVRHRITKLVRLTIRRPFLCEGHIESPAGRARNALEAIDAIENMLHHSVFLVVGLF